MRSKLQTSIKRLLANYGVLVSKISYVDRPEEPSPVNQFTLDPEVIAKPRSTDVDR